MGVGVGVVYTLWIELGVGVIMDRVGCWGRGGSWIELGVESMDRDG